MAPKLVFDVANMQLALNDTAVNIYRFEGTPDMPWFQAKPVITFLDYSNITTTLDKVPEKNKSSLQELVETKGTPIGGVRDSLTPLLGYNDGKAIYINESGLYQLIFGSKKEEAIIFTDWVTEEVLPSIRKHGRYGNDDDDGEQPLAKRRRIAEDIADVMEERQVELRKKHEQGVLSLVGQIKESQTTAIAEFEKRQTTAIAEFEQRHKIALGALASSVVTGVSLSISQKLIDVSHGVRDGVAQMFKPTGAFVVALRKATKLPAKKSSPDSIHFPPDQRATAEQLSLHCVMLATVVSDFVKNPYRTPVGVVLAGKTLTYGAWKAIRVVVGRRCKQARLDDESSSSGSPSPLLCEQPLRWAYTGPAYVYTKEEAQKYVLLSWAVLLLKPSFFAFVFLWTR